MTVITSDDFKITHIYKQIYIGGYDFLTKEDLIYLLHM